MIAGVEIKPDITMAGVTASTNIAIICSKQCFFKYFKSYLKKLLQGNFTK